MATATEIVHRTIAGGSFLIEERTPDEIMTPEDFTDEQRQIARTASDFVRNEVVPAAEEIEAKHFDITRALLKKAGDLGLMAVDIPEAYGGLAMDKVTSAIVADHLSQLGSFSVAFSAHVGIGTLPIVWYGTDAQKQKYLPLLATGESIGAYALSEATSGSDAMNIRARATLAPDGTHYILNGEKMWISNAGFADLFTVFVKVDGEKFTAFLIEKDTPGLSLGGEEHKLGIRGSSTCPLVLSDCKVPVENLLGEVGKGHHIAFNILNIGRLKLGPFACGGAKNVLAVSLKYAKERKAFGSSIADFGAIQHKLAEMAIRTFAAESMVWRTVGLIAPEESLKTIEEYAVECSIVKVYASEVLDYVVDEGVQIHGGYGYHQDYAVERAYCDSRINRIFEGTNEINRLLITGMLLKRAARGQLALVQAAQKLMGEILGGSAPDSGDEETRLVANAKKIGLLTMGLAYQKFAMDLEKQQEVLMGIADIVMEIYAMESVLLRTRKNGAGAEMSAVFLRDAMARVETSARTILAACSEGDSLRTNMAVLRRFAKYEPVNAIDLRRKIAHNLLAAERYLV